MKQAMNNTGEFVTGVGNLPIQFQPCRIDYKHNAFKEIVGLKGNVSKAILVTSFHDGSNDHTHQQVFLQNT